MIAITTVELIGLMMLVIPIHFCKYKKKKEVLEEGKFRTLYDGVKLKRTVTALNIYWFLVR